MTKHTSEMNNSNNFKQPEALRLADRLDREWAGDALTYDTALEAAAELRRLYAEVDRLSYQWAYPDNFERQPLPAHEIVTMYDESPTSDGDMIEFARAIEAAHGIMEDA